MGEVPGLIDCQAPNVIECQYCGARMQTRCGATREDKCKPCARLHGFDVARLVRSGFSGDRPEGFYLATLTAPGERETEKGRGNGIAWDRRRCKHPAWVKCSGKLGCSPSVDDCAAWNSSVPRRWWEVMRDLRRLLGVDVQYVGVWEDQQRGLLHRHAILWAEGVSTARMRAAWAEVGIKHGFGPNVFKHAACLPITSKAAHEAVRDATGEAPAAVLGDGLNPDYVASARYVSKYVTKPARKVWRVDAVSGDLVESGYRRWSASRDWGTTLRAIRESRREFHRARADARGPSSGGVSISDGGPDGLALGGGAALVLNRFISPELLGHILLEDAFAGCVVV